jgi:polyisoprenoid-binding protein YceI
MRASIQAFAVLSLAAGAAIAAPVTYEVDTKHTFPSFEADHFGGLSVWRGKFSGAAGKVILDKQAQTGSVEVSVDTATVNTGQADLDKHLKGGDFLDVEKFPKSTFKGKLAKFKDGAPTEVQGELTLHGVTRPLTLTVRSFKCQPHPMQKSKEVCGADAHGTFNREDFGIAWGKPMGFDMKVGLQIQIEATAAAN